MSRSTDLVARSEHNPILTVADVPYPVATVHNPAAARLDDGSTVLIFRSHLANGRCILGRADSRDGVHFDVSPEPWFTPASEGPFAVYEEFGVEDPRLTRIGEDWYFTYSAYSRHGVRIGMARTRDFETVERVAFITECDHRNTVLFPEQIDGDYVRFDRPHTDLTPWSIWVSRSPDLVHWGRSVRVHCPEVYHWTSLKIGPGALGARRLRPERRLRQRRARRTRRGHAARLLGRRRHRRLHRHRPDPGPDRRRPLRRAP